MNDSDDNTDKLSEEQKEAVAALTGDDPEDIPDEISDEIPDEIPPDTQEAMADLADMVDDATVDLSDFPKIPDLSMDFGSLGLDDDYLQDAVGEMTPIPKAIAKELTPVLEPIAEHQRRTAEHQQRTAQAVQTLAEESRSQRWRDYAQIGIVAAILVLNGLLLAMQLGLI